MEPHHGNRDIAYWVDILTEREFLSRAHHYHRNEWSYFSINHAEAQWLYKLGRDYQVLNMSYEEFASGLYRGGWERYPLKPRVCTSGCICWSCRYYQARQSTKYQKQKSHKKKQLKTSLNRDEKTKQYRSNSSKHKNWYGRKTQFKRANKRSHRAWERNMIDNERWDDIPTGNTAYKREDWWSWD